jgi:hypothetical protein
VDTLVKKLSQTGALVSPTPIKVPLFSDPGLVNDLPVDLENVLVEALRCHVSIELFGMCRQKVTARHTYSLFRIKVWLRSREQIFIQSQRRLSGRFGAAIAQLRDPSSQPHLSRFCGRV